MISRMAPTARLRWAPLLDVRAVSLVNVSALVGLSITPSWSIARRLMMGITGLDLVTDARAAQGIQGDILSDGRHVGRDRRRGSAVQFVEGEDLSIPRGCGEPLDSLRGVLARLHRLRRIRCFEPG